MHGGGVYRVLVRRPKGKRPLGRSRHRWEDNIKMDLREIGIDGVQGAFSLGVKWPGHEADYSPPSSAKVKECMELYLHSPNMPSWCGPQSKHKDFTFYLKDV
jgi:hypothetical protein